MSETIYDRTTSICLWAAIGSAIAFQNLSGLWQISVGCLGIVAAVTSMTVYFYFHRQPRDAKESFAAEVQGAPIEDIEENTKQKVAEVVDPIVWLDECASGLLRTYAFEKDHMIAASFGGLALAKLENRPRYQLYFRKDGGFEVRTAANPWKSSLLEEEDSPSSMPALRMMRSLGFVQ